MLNSLANFSIKNVTGIHLNSIEFFKCGLIWSSSEGGYMIFNKTNDFNPLSLKSDKHLISPYNITSCSNTQAMRIVEMIARHEMC